MTESPWMLRTTTAACFAMVVFGALFFANAAIQSDAYRALESWYQALPQTHYNELIRSGGFRDEIKVTSFRSHMLILSLQMTALGCVLLAYLRYWRPADAARGGYSLFRMYGSTTLLCLTSFILILHYAAACFLSLPGTRQLCALYAKEGPIDTLHAIGFFAAGLLLLCGAWTLSGRERRDDGSTTGRWVCFALGLLLCVFAFEEISWGQTWLKWSSPEFFELHNAQKETNAHNFFNKYLTPIYYALGAGVAFGTIAAFFLDDLFGRRWPLFRWLRPPAECLAIAVWFPVASEVFIYSNTEVFETLLTLYALCFAAGLYSKTKSGAVPAMAEPSDQAALVHHPQATAG